MTREQAAVIVQELTKIRKLLEDQDSTRLLTVQDVADRLQVSTSYVYDRADRLGAIRLPAGEGQRSRLRFPANVIELAAERTETTPTKSESVRTTTVEGIDLLPIGGNR